MARIKCGQQNCENEACFRYVWTDFRYACAECIQKILGMAAVMGFPTPASTVEYFPQSEEEAPPDAD